MKNAGFTLIILLVFGLFWTPLSSQGQTYGAAASDLAPVAAPQDQTPATMMHTLFDGPPRLASGPLDSAAYVEMEVQRLVNPGIAYVNWRALGKILKRLGFTTPPTFLTPELQEKIFEAAGFAMKLTGEDSSSYVQEFRRLYAIRYGGQFLNYNFGDGRGASGAYVQRKGIGKTPLVRPWADGSHSSGVLGLPEAIHEALWAAIFEEELPLGANPVLFIITTGTKVDSRYANSDDRAVVVREDMNRPGYYQRNTGVFSELLEPNLRERHINADQKRMEALIPKIAQALPFPKNIRDDATPGEYLTAALNQFIDNVALQYAAAYARQVYHGATSTTNILIDGRFLDFGTATAVQGYGKMRISRSDGANGETTNLKSDLVFEFLNGLRQELPEKLKSAVPTNDAAGATLDHLFKKHAFEQFLILAGTPKELAPEALATADGQEFADALLAVAQTGNDKILDWDRGDIATVTGTYKLREVLQKLFDNTYRKKRVKLSPAPAPMEMKDWYHLNLKSINYFDTLEKIALNHGIKSSTLSRAVEIGIKSRNTIMEEVREQPSMREKFKAAALNFTSEKDLFAVQNFIDETVERSVHEFKTSPYKIEVPLRVAGAQAVKNGKSFHLILDLKTGQEKIAGLELPGAKGAREFAQAGAPRFCRDVMNF